LAVFGDKLGPYACIFLWVQVPLLASSGAKAPEDSIPRSFAKAGPSHSRFLSDFHALTEVVERPPLGVEHEILARRGRPSDVSADALAAARRA